MLLWLVVWRIEDRKVRFQNGENVGDLGNDVVEREMKLQRGGKLFDVRIDTGDQKTYSAVRVYFLLVC